MSGTGADAASGHDLVVVGSANADLVVRVGRRPGPGETVLGSDLAVHPGGKGANQAVAAARLGAAVALLARVGDDDHGRLLTDSLAGAGVDGAAVLRGGAPTGVALITVDPSGDNSIVVSPGANARLTPGDVRAAAGLVRAARVVSAQLEIPAETVVELAAVAAGAGTRFVLNPSPVPAPPAAAGRGGVLVGDVLRVCDPLVVNEHEARAVLAGAGSGASSGAGVVGGSVSAEEWAEGLLALGPRSVVVTLGAAGAVVADGAGTARVAAAAVEAVDTTGAGDAFTATLAWRLGAGEGLAAAAAFASRVAGVAVTRAGAQASYPTLREVGAASRGAPPP